jgi:hypothetical protein
MSSTSLDRLILALLHRDWGKDRILDLLSTMPDPNECLGRRIEVLDLALSLDRVNMALDSCDRSLTHLDSIASSLNSIESKLIAVRATTKETRNDQGK